MEILNNNTFDHDTNGVFFRLVTDFISTNFGRSPESCDHESSLVTNQKVLLLTHDMRFQDDLIADTVGWDESPFDVSIHIDLPSLFGPMHGKNGIPSSRTDELKSLFYDIITKLPHGLNILVVISVVTVQPASVNTLIANALNGLRSSMVHLHVVTRTTATAVELTAVEFESYNSF